MTADYGPKMTRGPLAGGSEWPKGFSGLVGGDWREEAGPSGRAGGASGLGEVPQDGGACRNDPEDRVTVGGVRGEPPGERLAESATSRLVLPQGRSGRGCVRQRPCQKKSGAAAAGRSDSLMGT